MTDTREMELYAEMERFYEAIGKYEMALQLARDEFTRARRTYDNYRAGKKQEQT